MDRPLLALTRSRPASPQLTSVDAGADNMRQLIQLRWIAVAGQVFAILTAHFLLEVRLPLTPMLAIAAGLAGANVAFTLALRRFAVAPGEFLVALLLDMAALTGQLYLSGGATNPFISLYLLQVVLGAILLPPVQVAALVATCCSAFAFLSLAHRPLRLPAKFGAAWADLLMIGQWLAFLMVATLLLLFITRISRNLRARDAHVAELAQQAIEDEAVVRMGLFASGAAHELGTPLSSLAVLLADWRRDPRIAGHPELVDELGEAQGELQRCKQIVSNILHSAGEARGEAMGSVAVIALLGGVADTFREAHPDIALARDFRDLDRARVAAEPALRQAIWNLLENAVDSGTRALTLAGHRAGGFMRITVEDRGTGFTAAQLAGIGTLYQSSKGPGHGLGLFLAVNVVRRLGGKLEAANRADGGAAVTMILPLLPEEE